MCVQERQIQESNTRHEAPEGAVAVELVGASKSYGDVHALRELDLSARLGRCLVLLGPNGAGKTTALGLITGILRPSAGVCRVFGLECFRDRAKIMERLAYAPAEPHFPDSTTAHEVTRFASRMRGIEPDTAKARIDRLARKLELESAMDRDPSTFSKGMSKKLALLLALLARPRFLVLDEPFNGLDPRARRTLTATLRELRDDGVGILLCTHDFTVAEALADDIIIVDGGRARARGTLEELGGADRQSLESAYFATTEA
ncbi:MAG: ABC transporter ATP-binding protein [Deltaproteobacteria bacterium]|nr:ABC transporter ATP-binding protein [Deltaproteobacteria bacterium]